MNSKLVIICLAFFMFALGCTEFVIIGVEPEVASGLGVSLASVGNLVGYFALAYAISTPVLTLATGRFKRYPLFAVYLAILTGGNVLAAVAPSYGVLMAARMLTAAVSGGVASLVVTFVPDIVGEREVSGTVSLLYASFSVACVAAAPMGSLIADALGWQVAFGAVAILMAVLSAAVLAVLPRSGSSDAPASVADQLELLRYPNVLGCIALFVFSAGAVYSFYTYVTPYLEDACGMSAGGVSAFLVVFGCMCIVSNLLSGQIASRAGVRGLIPVMAVQALVLAGIWLAGGIMLPSLALILGVGLVMYLINSPCVSLFLEVAGRECPRALTLAGALEPMSFNIGITLGSLVGGAALGAGGLALTALAGAALGVVAFGVAIVTARLDARWRAGRWAA